MDHKIFRTLSLQKKWRGRRSTSILISEHRKLNVSPGYLSHHQINSDQVGQQCLESKIGTYFKYPNVKIPPKVTNTRLQRRTRPAKSLKLAKGRSGVEERM